MSRRGYESELEVAGGLLRTTLLRDRVVTGDALYCQRQLCERVVDEGGDYVLIVKGNQQGLYEDIELCFERPIAGESYAYAQMYDRHGGRNERRRLWVTGGLKSYLDWPGHQQVFKVERLCSDRGGLSCQVRYGITSLGPHTPAERLLELVRGHWAIENRLHYVRDVTMDEDRSQIRSGAAPQVMAALRNLVLNVLRLLGEANIAAAIRRIGWQPNGALRALGLSTR